MHEIPWVLLETQLLVDLHYFELHLGSCKFNYGDKRTTADLFSMGDCFFKFDYKSSYHQVEIFPWHFLVPWIHLLLCRTAESLPVLGFPIQFVNWVLPFHQDSTNTGKILEG